MMHLPSSLSCAPTTNNSCPPTPEYWRGPTVSAMTWPLRSTAIAPLMLTMRRLPRMIAGSLTCITGSMRTSGLRCIQRYSRRCRREGRDREAVEDALVVAHLARLVQVHDAVDEHLGVDAEVALVALREACATMLGMPPMPNWSVAPSGTSEATKGADDAIGVVVSTSGSTKAWRSDWITQSTSSMCTRWPPYWAEAEHVRHVVDDFRDREALRILRRRDERLEVRAGMEAEAEKPAFVHRRHRRAPAPAAGRCAHTAPEPMKSAGR
jgi:hypothetical protein